MIIHEVNQGSEDWHRARAGVITASMFKLAREKVGGLTEQQKTYADAILAGKSQDDAKKLAGYKAAPTSTTIQKYLAGEIIESPSEAAKNYAFRIAVERVSGVPLDEGFETWAMRRGHELEPEARNLYEIKSGNNVQIAGFVTTDCGYFGASADGLIDDNGGLEIKCLVSPERIRQAILDFDVSEWYDQIQGGLMITGREFWDFVIYCPALEAAGRDLTRWTYARDEAYIQKLAEDLDQFNELVDSYLVQLITNKPHALAA